MENFANMELMGWNLFELAGLAGVGAYLGSYAALQTGFLRGSGFAYAIANLVAASLVLISLTRDFNLSSALIQISWIIISTVGIMRLYYLKNAVHFDERERALLQARFAGLSNDLAQRLLKAGRWQNATAGTVLTIEDAPTCELHYLLDGSAVIHRDAKTIAQVGSGNFVGEVTCFTAENATATAIMAEAGTIFSIDVETLRKIAPVGSALRDAIELAIANDLRDKLSGNNASLLPAGGKDTPSSAVGPRTLEELNYLTAA